MVGGGEFPANLNPWWNAGRAGLIRPHIIDAPSGVTPDLLASQLEADDTAVSVSAVDYRTGYRADLSAIRDVIGPHRLLIVDAIQSFGVCNQSWESADVVIAGGQKWMRAGWGVAGMSLSTNALERVLPTASSWAGSAAAFAPATLPAKHLPGAARFNVTNLSPPAVASFQAGLELIERTTVQRIEKSIALMVERFVGEAVARRVEIVSPHQPEYRAGIVVIHVQTSRASSVRRELDKLGYSYT